jgi:hypothetical protein
LMAMSGWAQSQAALDCLVAHRTAGVVEQMRVEAHHRYMGELFFYSASFMVEESGVLRQPTEEEIAAIDLHVYDGIRLDGVRIGVQDPVLNAHIVLLSRSEFEGALLESLSHEDRAAYLDAKARALAPSTLKAP